MDIFIVVCIRNSCSLNVASTLPRGESVPRANGRRTAQFVQLKFTTQTLKCDRSEAEHAVQSCYFVSFQEPSWMYTAFSATHHKVNGKAPISGHGMRHSYGSTSLPQHPNITSTPSVVVLKCLEQVVGESDSPSTSPKVVFSSWPPPTAYK